MSVINPQNSIMHCGCKRIASFLRNTKWILSSKEDLCIQPTQMAQERKERESTQTCRMLKSVKWKTGSCIGVLYSILTTFNI